jgi:hypothetical protein
MFRFIVRVGRLAEATLGSPLTLRDVESFYTETRLGLLALPTPALVVCDLTQIDVMPPEASDRLIELVKRDSARIERGAYLLRNGQGSLPMQIARIIRQAKSPSRRLFHAKEPLRAWLGEAATEAEKKALDVFLAAIVLREAPR